MNKLGRLRHQPVGVQFIEPDTNGRHKCRPYNKLFIILIFSSILLTSCGAGQPKGGEGISYFGAAWLNNERIIYTKQVDTVKFHYGWLAEVANMTSELIRTDYYICTMDLNGEDERILKQFRFVYASSIEGPRYYIIEGDKKTEIPYMIIPPLTQDYYSCSNDLIVFGSGTIYTMKIDGSELKRVEKGVNPRISPDGKLILYDYPDPIALEAYEKRTEFQEQPPRSIWLINIDGTGKRKLVEPGSEGIWSPDGKRIAYWKEEPDRYHNTYIVGLDGQNFGKVEQDTGTRPCDWTSDGSIIMFEGGFFNILTNQWVKLSKLAALPNYPRLSPDEWKIVGRNAGLDADICVVYMNESEREKAVKVLRKTHFKKWDN